MTQLQLYLIRLIKLNPSELQIINSSAILDICIEQTETLYKKSKTKSLSETVSIEFLVGLFKTKFFTSIVSINIKRRFQ
jgi:hypothetical protein